MHTSIGAAWELDRGWIGVGLDFLWVTHRTAFGAWNGRIGGRYEIFEDWSVGAGLYTDHRFRTPTPTDFGQASLTNYGGNVGLQWRTRHPLSDGDEIKFVTALAFGYAYGFGEFGALEIDAFATDPFETREIFVTDAVFHELQLHIGTTMRF